ncbi:MAG: putative sugar nucleotidyl transferase [Candidatus Zixiibacteriota bacterium]
MEKRLIVFEDEAYRSFYPLTHIRPVFFLRPGIRNIFEQIRDSFPDYRPSLFCRPELGELVAEQVEVPVNEFTGHSGDQLLLINGRLRVNAEFASALNKANRNAILLSSGAIAAVKVVDGLTAEEATDLKNGELGDFVARVRRRSETLELELPLYHYLWDMVGAIDAEIATDFEFLRKQINNDIESLVAAVKDGSIQRHFPGVHFIRPEQIYLAPSLHLSPTTVIDASAGPVFLGSEVKVEPLSYIVGPCYIGKGSMVTGGKISGCSIGAVCRVGGEVEETIIQGYTNKYHAGFLGHSYVGEWVNFGAMTTNSDLKNNYTPVKVAVNGKEVDTGSLKVGSFIGDFTKTAIGTLLNTGINIGISCNLVSDSLVVDKEIPDFTWYSMRHKMEYSMAKALDTIERTMARREKKLTAALRKRLEEVSRDRLKVPQAKSEPLSKKPGLSID